MLINPAFGFWRGSRSPAAAGDSQTRALPILESDRPDIGRTGL